MTRATCYHVALPPASIAKKGKLEMLTLTTPAYFGKDDRFKAYERVGYTRKLEVVETTISTLPACIFVQDNENFDDYGLPEIVFQEWTHRIDSLDQVINIVAKRYPDAFDDRYNAVFFSPTRDEDREY